MAKTPLREACLVRFWCIDSMKADRDRAEFERVSIYDPRFATNGLSVLNSDNDGDDITAQKS